MKEGGGFWDDLNGGYLREDLVLAARREAIDWVHSEGVFEIVPMQECRDAGMKPQKSGRVGDDVHTSALDVFFEKDGRRSRYIGEVLERYRGEDAGDLKRSALDELVENWTSLNVLEKEIF